jgi:hypothetical protein
MALRKISDLKPVFSGDNVTEWQSPAGTRYRYSRARGAVGPETSPGSEVYDWHILDKNDLTHAKRKVFELINLDEF